MTNLKLAPSAEVTSEFELERCVKWTRDNNYTKVCLQFPDSLLEHSVDIALYIDRGTGNKTFILGDTSYGSCCVDEVASQHVKADAIIHFGHACLSITNLLPVLYIIPKSPINVTNCLKELNSLLLNGTTLLLFDASFSHLRDKIISKIPDGCKDSVVTSELIIGKATKTCGDHCCALEKSSHTSTRFSRGFCTLSNGHFDKVIYIGYDSVINNFLLMMKDVKFYHYNEEDGLKQLNPFQSYKRMSFLIEKVKAAENIGILVGTLSVDRYLDALSHVKKLCKRRKKNLYTISVGKPNPAKLSNFPEIDVFVMITCPETNFFDSKTCIQPIVGLLEVELAFNENRSWENTFSNDFRDLIEGGPDYIEVPQGIPENNLEVALVSNNLHRNINSISNSKEISLNPEMRLRTSDFSTRIRTWDGLELKIGDTPVTNTEKGRSGTAQGYSCELNSINSS